MNVLFLDIASHQGLIACVSDDAVIESMPVDHRIDDAQLIPTIESTLKKAKWDFKDLTNVACVVGPGGFTSLRVAVAAANTIADQLQIPAAGIHLSDLYAARASDKPFMWLHSTKKEFLFARTFGIDDWRWAEPTLASVPDIHDYVRAQYVARVLWTGELIPAHRDAIDKIGLQEMPLIPIEKILPAFLKNQTYSRDLLLPWYGRGW